MSLIKFLFSKKFVKQIFYFICIATSILIVSVISLSYTTMHGESVEVPNLVGKTIEQGRVGFNNFKFKLHNIRLCKI